MDSVDTGERRPLGSFTARHVISSTLTEAAPGATMHSLIERRDGWYIDLPGMKCQELNQGAAGVRFLTPGPSSRPDHLHLKRLGTAPLGFPIEETRTRTEDGRTLVNKTELLDFALTRLDSALFEKPTGCTSARRTPHGRLRHDPADTLTNRAQVYWSELRDSLRDLFGER